MLSSYPLPLSTTSLSRNTLPPRQSQGEPATRPAYFNISPVNWTDLLHTLGHHKYVYIGINCPRQRLNWDVNTSTTSLAVSQLLARRLSLVVCPHWVIYGLDWQCQDGGAVMIKTSCCVVFTSLQPIVDVQMMDDVLTPGCQAKQSLHRNDSHHQQVTSPFLHLHWVSRIFGGNKELSESAHFNTATQLWWRILLNMIKVEKYYI